MLPSEADVGREEASKPVNAVHGLPADLQPGLRVKLEHLVFSLRRRPEDVALHEGRNGAG